MNYSDELLTRTQVIRELNRERDALAARVAELEAALAEEQHWVAEWRAVAEAREAACAGMTTWRELLRRAVQLNTIAHRFAVTWAVGDTAAAPDTLYKYECITGEEGEDA